MLTALNLVPFEPHTAAEMSVLRLPRLGHHATTLHPPAPKTMSESALHLQDALELAKRDMAAEEVELLDVERQMEEELVDEFKQVERVIATRVDAVEGDHRFLVKVRPRTPLLPQEWLQGALTLLRDDLPTGNVSENYRITHPCPFLFHQMTRHACG